MSLPKIRNIRCEACQGTGNESRTHSFGNRWGTVTQKRILISCKVCGGRGYTKERVKITVPK